jgi:hypothetical protein
MDEAQINRVVHMLAKRSILLECQIIALRAMLNRSGTVPDADFDRSMKLALETYKEFLAGRKTDAETLEEFLRKFEGPIQ